MLDRIRRLESRGSTGQFELWPDLHEWVNKFRPKIIAAAPFGELISSHTTTSAAAPGQGGRAPASGRSCPARRRGGCGRGRRPGFGGSLAREALAGLEKELRC